MRQSLPQCSGDDIMCVKCGHEGADTDYWPQVSGFDLERSAIHGAPSHAEFLERTCGRCEYWWAEECLNWDVIVPAPETDVMLNQRCTSMFQGDRCELNIHPSFWNHRYGGREWPDELSWPGKAPVSDGGCTERFLGVRCELKVHGPEVAHSFELTGLPQDLTLTEKDDLA